MDIKKQGVHCVIHLRGGYMAQKKKFSDLDLSNAFMFAAVLADPEICRMILEMILDRRGDVPEILIHFLRYVEESTDSCVEAVQDSRIVDLHDRITQIKRNQEWEGRYMTFEELLMERELEGRKLGTIEGRKLGESKMLSLLRILKKDNPSAIERIIEDPEFCQEMFKKYNI